MENNLLKDKDYDLISVIYHASQGAEICKQYSADAEKAGDNETAQFFKEVQEQNAKLVQKGKDLLKKCL
jgi:hypothetical protein